MKIARILRKKNLIFSFVCFCVLFYHENGVNTAQKVSAIQPSVNGSSNANAINKFSFTNTYLILKKKPLQRNKDSRNTFIFYGGFSYPFSLPLLTV